MAESLWVEGWTAKRKFKMLADGVAADLSSLTLTALVLSRADGTAVSTTGDTAIESPASAGVVSYTPSSEDLKANDSPLTARWKFTDGSAKILFFPNGEADVWKVRK